MIAETQDEDPRTAVSQHARCKRQTGDYGQFADVEPEILPRPRGEGFAPKDSIDGNAAPRQFIVSVGAC